MEKMNYIVGPDLSHCGYLNESREICSYAHHLSEYREISVTLAAAHTHSDAGGCVKIERRAKHRENATTPTRTRQAN